ncbi:radical SAM protein [candidate division KSB1 bacterium]|nr:radical SAM protein [candidate division KSB1 bacterium]
MNGHVVKKPLRDFEIWDRYDGPDKLYSFDLELTARCNLNCRHCYINLPAGHSHSACNELTIKEISRIADQAVDLGAMWCLLSGGEPLLRKDFGDIYLMLKKKGLLLSVFTNATLISDRHIELFLTYPPRDIEITVYGVTPETYEKVTRRPGSFQAFKRGLDLLVSSGLQVRLKAMALRSNVHEMSHIAEFCRRYTKDYFRYDANLHLRFDRDVAKNRDIISERLSAAEVVALEESDRERFAALQEQCDKYVLPEFERNTSTRVFACGIGSGGSVNIGYDGQLRLCSSLYHPDYMFDLRSGTIKEALRQLVQKVKNLTSNREKFLTHCRACSLVNVCQWCPAVAYLETGLLDEPVDHFCRVAHARADSVQQPVNESAEEKTTDSQKLL